MEPMQKGSFPTSKEDIALVRAKFVEMFYDAKLKNGIVKILQGPPEQAMDALAMQVVQFINKMGTAIKKQFQVQKINGKLAEMLVKLAIEEISNISQEIGNGPMPPETMESLQAMTMQQLQGAQQGPQQGGPPPQQEIPGGVSPRQGILGREAI